MTVETLLVVMAIATAGVWVAVLLLGTPLTPRRRAGVVFTLAVAQPLALLILGHRAPDAAGAQVVLSATAVIVGELMNLAMLAAAATLILSPGEAVGRQGRLLLTGVWGIAGALLISSALSASGGSARYSIYFAVALTGVVFGTADRETLVLWSRRTTRIVVAVSLGSAVVAAHWAFIGKGASGYDRTFFGIPRLVGLSPHPNALSEVAAVGLLLEAGFRQGRTSARLAAGAAAAACLLLTQSVTGYIAGALGLLVILAVRFATYRRLLVALALTLFSVYVFAPSWILPPSVTGNDYVNSVSGRTLIWQLSLDEWRRHPLFGYGPNMFSQQYIATHFPATLHQATNGHNQIVQTLADSGLFGAAALVLVLASLGAMAWRCRPIDGGTSLGLVIVIYMFCTTETPLRAVGVVAIPALVTLGIVLTTARAVPGAMVNRALSGRGVSSQQAPLALRR